MVKLKDGDTCPMCEINKLKLIKKDLIFHFRNKTKIFKNQIIFKCDICKYEGSNNNKKINKELEIFRQKVNKIKGEIKNANSK